MAFLQAIRFGLRLTGIDARHDAATAVVKALLKFTSEFFGSSPWTRILKLLSPMHRYLARGVYDRLHPRFRPMIRSWRSVTTSISLRNRISHFLHPKPKTCTDSI